MLTQVLKLLLTTPANHVTPVPDEVVEAGEDELEDPWQEKLREFVAKSIEPIEKTSLANTAAEVREQFFRSACGSVKQWEVRLKLARKGFHETTQAVREGMRKSTKRVYQYAFGCGSVQYVKLIAE